MAAVERFREGKICPIKRGSNLPKEIRSRPKRGTTPSRQGRNFALKAEFQQQKNVHTLENQTRWEKTLQKGKAKPLAYRTDLVRKKKAGRDRILLGRPSIEDSISVGRSGISTNFVRWQKSTCRKVHGKYDLVKTSPDCKEGKPEAPQVEASTFDPKGKPPARWSKILAHKKCEYIKGLLSSFQSVGWSQ